MTLVRDARYLDSSWIFLRQYELCSPHTQRLILRDRRRGLKIIDKRPFTLSG